MLSDLFRFFLVGLGPGGIYGLLTIGIILVYRGSGVVNFAGGGFALAGAATFMELRGEIGTAGAVLAGVAVGGALGVATQLLLMHPMRRAAPLTRVVATLGVMVALQQVAELRYGADSIFVEAFLPLDRVEIGSATITSDRLIILSLAVLLTVALAVFYRYSTFGIATTAVSENTRSAAAAGWSPNIIACVNWALGGGLAGGAGVLLVPMLGFAPNTFTMTVVPALAAAVVAGFRSFPLALVGGVLLGVLESEGTYLQTRYPRGLFGFIPTTGLSSSVPFLVMIGLMTLRGRALPLRADLTDRLPALGTGEPRWQPFFIVLGAFIASIWLFSGGWVASLASCAAVALIALSVVLVTGYAGQLSLVQFALAGLGAFFSSRLADVLGWPFPVAAAAGVVLTVLFGVIVALPAVRVRGVNLAVVTLGFSVVISAAILANPNWNGGGIRGTRVSPPTLLGLEVDAVDHPQRWALLCLLVATAAALAMANLRRGRSGRRLIAVRENERAAASLGVNVITTKLYAFAAAAALAGAGGVLLAFRNVTVTFDQYSPFKSIEIVLLTVIGGLGFITGGLLAGASIVSGLVHHAINHLWHIEGSFKLILSLLFLIAIVVHPDGFAHRVGHVIHRQRHTKAQTRQVASQATPEAPGDLTSQTREQHAHPVVPRTLRVDRLGVRFGGLVAVNDLTFTVGPGEVVGLIGPNGAGKTTVIDAVTGFVPSSGRVSLDGTRLDGRRADSRARIGLTRSFQSLELFEDLSVADNLRLACDDGGWRSFLLDPLRRRPQELSDAAVAAIAEFDLEEVLDKKPDQLPYPKRRLVAIARAVAAAPSIVMLDEPAAGLDAGSRLELEHLVRRLASDWGIGVLLVEHDVELVMRTCDRVIALSFGQELASGTPQEMRRNEALIESYLGQRRDPSSAARPLAEKS